jgi:photosystem II stability/assembly factor-like uncharacterized protein
MKKRITKFWGVGLIVALLASMLVALPASAADPLQWNEEAIPASPGILSSGANITDLAVCADGTTMYAATGTTTVYKSTNAGVSWTPCGSTGLTAVSLVAVAPDNNNMVAVADTSSIIVYISTNGGTSWGSLSTPGTATTINDIDMSAASPDNNLAVAGDDSTNGNVWIYGLGIGGSWRATGGYAGLGNTAETILAIAFSPNYASDNVLTAVSTNVTAAKTYFNMLSLNSNKWNASEASFGIGYPNEIGTSINATGASIALAPTYLGGDEVERVGFVGVNGCTTATKSGIYRVKNSADTQVLESAEVYSIAYDGTIVVAGSTGTTVFRCEDPLVTSPTFFPSSDLKSPGGLSTTANTIVAFSGTTVVAGTSGTMSAFAVSTDNGKSFNDISLIDTAVTNIGDLGAGADGSKVYMVSNDGSNTSVFRYDTSWQRILSFAGTGSYIIRLSPDDADVAYVAMKTGTTTYYTKDGGEGRWYSRTTEAVQDIAVQSTDVAYLAIYNTATVRKTSNGGFTWGPPGKDTKLGGYVYSIACLGEDKAIVGGVNGKVSYTTDGNSSWAPVPNAITGATNTVVTASDLADGGLIYTGSAAGVYRWTIGQASTEPWKSIDANANSTYTVTGIVLQDGVLYAASSNGTSSEISRSTAPSPPSPPPFDTISASGKNFAGAPASLKISSTDYSNKLWVLDTVTAKVYSYDDTLTKVSPAPTVPPDGMQVKINSLSGDAYDVSYSWPEVKGATAYELKIYLDAAGDQLVQTVPVSGGPPTIAKVVGPSTDPVAVYMPGTTYYWRVKVSSPISSPWSAMRSFTIEVGSALVPSIGSPANGSTVYSVPAFSWSPVAGTTKYQFDLSSDTVFAVPIYTVQIPVTGIQPEVTLDAGTYFWRVKALEPVPGEWSTIANFTLTAAPKTAAPTSTVQVTVPTITVPPVTVPPANVTVQPAPAAEPAISQGLLWAVIIIGAVLVIALIVLIVRTRRSV